MKLKGNVLNVNLESRELVGKDGQKAFHQIGRVLLLVSEDGRQCVVTVKMFDNPDFMTLDKYPPIGKEWTTPRIRKYECYDGMAAEVSV